MEEKVSRPRIESSQKGSIDTRPALADSWLLRSRYLCWRLVMCCSRRFATERGQTLHRTVMTDVSMTKEVQMTVPKPRTRSDKSFLANPNPSPNPVRFAPCAFCTLCVLLSRQLKFVGIRSNRSSNNKMKCLMSIFCCETRNE